jgi:fructosamine-3-kinase
MIPPLFDHILRSLYPHSPPVSHFHRVTGGDINQAYCLEAGEQKFFCKLQAADPGRYMFATEIRGLHTLREHYSRVPAIYGSGVREDKAFLLLEWIETGTPHPARWRQFGEELARLHGQQAPRFGFMEDNYIGSLPQRNFLPGGPGGNDRADCDWADFYFQARLLPLLERGINAKIFNHNILHLTEGLPRRIRELFPPEPPSLLHGDLWSGNTRLGPRGHVWIYDPAVYYGHREMDLAMTRLFGGFSPECYEAYAHHYPPGPGWEERVSLCQLYPLLVHALLFGGDYVRECLEIIGTYA